MNKQQLIEQVANKANVTKAQAKANLEATLEVITNELSNGSSIQLVGFGTFSVSDRAARSGVNPSTGAKIQIAASKLPKFKAGKVLKTAVN
jgi:DNA-binding protein HU-alpha